MGITGALIAITGQVMAIIGQLMAITGQVIAITDPTLSYRAEALFPLATPPSLQILLSPVAFYRCGLRSLFKKMCCAISRNGKQRRQRRRAVGVDSGAGISRIDFW